MMPYWTAHPAHTIYGCSKGFIRFSDFTLFVANWRISFGLKTRGRGTPYLSIPKGGSMQLFLSWNPNTEFNVLDTQNIVIHFWIPYAVWNLWTGDCNESHQITQYFLSSNFWTPNIKFLSCCYRRTQMLINVRFRTPNIGTDAPV